MGKVNDFLFANDQDDRGAEDSAAAGGETLSQGESEAACEISDAQQARLYPQAVTVLDMLEEESVRDLLILEHTQAASDSLEADPSAGKDMAQEAMENASLVRLNSSLLLIVQKVTERSARKVGPTTLLSFTRQFRQLGGCFKRDGRGVRKREWILSEEDLDMDLINWLKAQKRITTKNIISIHIVYSLSAFVDRGAYLSISTHIKDTLEYSSRRAEFCEFGPKLLTRDLECTLQSIC